MKTKKTIILTSVISCVLLFFTIHRFIFFKPGVLEQTASLLVYPFLKLQNVLVRPLQNYYQEKSTIAQLKKKIGQLEQEKRDLLAETITVHSTLWYTEKTKELIDFGKRYSYDQMPCVQIIMKQFTAEEHSMLIDYGSMHGAEIDMIAIYKNCLVGRVTQVFPYYSKILLISDPLCKVPVYCYHSKAPGIYEGILNQSAGTLRYVSHLYTLQCDELVISSGEGVIFPQGFALGTVHWFELDGLHYSVVVKPLLSLTNLDYCYLMKKGSL